MEPIHRGQQRTKLGEEDVHCFLRGSHFFADLPTYSVESEFIFSQGGMSLRLWSKVSCWRSKVSCLRSKAHILARWHYTNADCGPGKRLQDRNKDVEQLK